MEMINCCEGGFRIPIHLLLLSYFANFFSLFCEKYNESVLKFSSQLNRSKGNEIVNNLEAQTN